MSSYTILDTCFLRPQVRDIQAIQMLGTIGMYSQKHFDCAIAQDVAVLEYLKPLVASRDIFVLRQVCEEIQGFRNALNKRVERASITDDWKRFNLDSFYDYCDRLGAFHQSLKPLEPTKSISVVQREREQEYYNRILMYVTQHPLTQRSLHKHIVARHTDEKIISLAFALAHKRTTYVLTRDGPLANAIKGLGIEFMEDTRFVLPKKSIFVPSFNFDIEQENWIKTYDARYAQFYQSHYAQKQTPGAAESIESRSLSVAK